MAGVKGQRSGGHNAKTLAQHDLEGTRRVDRHKGFRNPEPPDGEPETPRELSGEALAAWERTCGHKRRDGTLSVGDGDAIYLYSKAWTDMLELEDEVATLSSRQYIKVTVDGAGTEHEELKVREIVKELRAQRLVVDRLAKSLGLTPDSRGRVRLPTGGEVKKVSPLEAIQAGAVIN